MLLNKRLDSHLSKFFVGFLATFTTGLVLLVLFLFLAVWRGSGKTPGADPQPGAASATAPAAKETPTPSPESTTHPAAAASLTPVELTTTQTVNELTSTPVSEPAFEPTKQTNPTASYGQSTIIGYSVNGLPLEVYQFGNGAAERMIVAGIHGGYEWNTVALADELIAYLMENPALVPPEVTLFILRNMNPDGYEKARGAAGRANANGVDLNRNFDAHWLADWNRDTCFNQVFVTAGPEPGSEPESQAVMAFINSHNIEALINYHSAALGIFPGGIPPGPRSQRLAYALSQLSPYQYPPKDVGCVYSGVMVNWVVAQNIPAVDLELSTHGATDFDINLRILKYFLQPDLGLGVQ